LERVRNEYHVPALAAAFVRDGRIVAAVAVGVRRNDRSEPVAIDDRFHLGSVSKPFTATVIATLVEDGKLDWGTTVAEVFPDFSDRVDPAYLNVTLENLLSHRAGVAAWAEDEEMAQAAGVTGTPRQQRRAATLRFLGRPAVVPPGTQHLYSNAGYMIAAAMAEERAGVPWETLVHERLSEPLGLTSLGFGWPAKDDPAQPWGHYPSRHGPIPHDPKDSYQVGPLLGPAGDLQMNITDLARFALLHLDGVQGRARILSPESFQRLHRPIGDYALGWNVRDTADHHLGGMGTFLAGIWISKPRNVAIVMATNVDPDPAIVSAVITGTLRTFRVPEP